MSNQLYASLPTFYLMLPPVTRGALVAILLVTVFFHIRFDRRSVSLGPRLLTIAGIFATFLCVALDLTDLNPGDVQASILSLLVGLKTALWSTLFGIGAALTLRLREYIFGTPAATDAQTVPGDLTAADLSRHLGTIQKALSGSDQGALVSQVKLTRQDGRVAQGLVIKVPRQQANS